MRFAPFVLALSLSSPAWGGDGALQVYVCEAGQIAARTYSVSELPGYKQLVRSGNAYWVDGRIDTYTATAMFEGAGIWGFASPRDVFSKVETKTAASVLSGIATTESGRNGRPWPWTINSNGRSFYFESRDKAIAAAKTFVSADQNLFDIGLMQVNWRYHGHRFTSLEQAFDPVTNIRVADSIVQEHLAKTGSLKEAIGRYHSKTPSLKNSYLTRVLNQIDRLAVQKVKPSQLPRC